MNWLGIVLETKMMNPDHFYQQIAKLAALSPYDRYARLGRFHTDLVLRYLDVIRPLDAEEAGEVSSSGRPISQIIAEVAEWERFTIAAAGEIICGVQWPQMMNLAGYLDSEGQPRCFDSVDNFKSYLQTKYLSSSWAEIRDLALHTATALHTLFTQPTLLSPDTLQKTRKHEWLLPNGLKVTLPVGWYLWMTTIEREATTYATELNWLK